MVAQYYGYYLDASCHKARPFHILNHLPLDPFCVGVSEWRICLWSMNMGFCFYIRLAKLIRIPISMNNFSISWKTHTQTHIHAEQQLKLIAPLRIAKTIEIGFFVRFLAIGYPEQLCGYIRIWYQVVVFASYYAHIASTFFIVRNYSSSISAQCFS